MIDHNLPKDLDDIYGEGAEENYTSDDETFAQTEARELLKEITDVPEEKIDSLSGEHCETWLNEMGYEWDENSNGWLIV